MLIGLLEGHVHQIVLMTKGPICMEFYGPFRVLHYIFCLLVYMC